MRGKRSFRENDDQGKKKTKDHSCIQLSEILLRFLAETTRSEKGEGDGRESLGPLWPMQWGESAGKSHILGSPANWPREQRGKKSTFAIFVQSKKGGRGAR